MIPPGRRQGDYAVALVCLGNICRSPIADVVLSAAVAELPVTVASAGTGPWHVGEPMDSRAAAVLRAHGYDPSSHRAQQFTPEWHSRFDLVLAMDSENLASLGGPTDRVRLFRSFDRLGTGDVPDPYYGGDDGFEEVLVMVVRTVSELARELGAQ